MFEQQLRDQLASVGNRLSRLWLWKRLAWCWTACTLLILAAFFAFPKSVLAVSAIALASALVAILLWARSKSLPLARTEIARTVEQAFPDLNSRLLAALEQSPDMTSGRWNVLQRQVISEALHHSRINDWAEAVPVGRMRRAFLRQAVALTALVLVCGYVWPVSAQRTRSDNSSNVAVDSPRADSDGDQPVVEPGTIELERGSNLLVLARFPGQPPANVALAWRPAAGDEVLLPLTKSLDDPVFAGQLPRVMQDITYRVDYDTRQSTEFQVTVYDLPALVRSDLVLKFPSYTGLATKALEDAFVATVVEGTTIGITCRLNKPVALAKLVDKDGTTIPLTADPANPLIHSVDFVPTRTHRMELRLIDEAGRQNRDPEEFRFEARPNTPPEIKLAFPGQDVKVSPLEEVLIEATAWDDFGILQAGLVLTIPGRDPVTIPLGTSLKPGEHHKLSALQRLEELKVEPDELVSYYIFAEDHGPDGQVRRVSSDLYFAEVRPFEEIFRQLEGPPGGQSQSSGSQQQGNPMDKLIELQKQIVTATWKLARPPHVKFDAKTGESLKVIQESQQKAITQLEAMHERITNPMLIPILAVIGERMAEAEKTLGEAIADSTIGPLGTASVAEQGAYQGLLKLRAKEHLMMKSQQSGSGSSSSSSVSQEQMAQLELDNKQNRYELQRAAQKQAESSQREELAVLDRLKELARRQQGINEKLKELEAELRAAKTEAEREEIERQLKRLRDDQQQLLHDADETQSKMAQSTQQAKMNEARDQLEQTRERMVDTAEKLREGQLSQALNSGTRAERELQQLHEDFRKQTAGRFADAMRTMREAARTLADREDQLAEQLKGVDDESKHSLRQAKNRSNLEAEFKEQRRQVAELVDDAKNVVDQAEEAEPLLAKQLYETVRSTRETKTDQALDATAQLLKAGFLPEAQQAEEQAREGINKLKEGIEKATESVLGDEVEALKRAREELAQLSNSLEQEIAQQQKEGQGQPGQGQPGQGQPGQGQPGQGQPGQGQPGQGQPGQGQPGQGQPGQGQPGQGQPGQGQPGQGQPGQGQPGQGQPGQGQPGQGQPGQGQPGQGQPGQGQPGQGQPGQGQPGQGQPGQGQPGQGQPGQGQPGQGQPGQGQPGQGQPGQGQGRQQAGLRGPGQGGKPSPGSPDSTGEQGGMGGGPGGQGGPLTGGNFSDWNERLRDVESMVSDPKLQAEVAKVRERARSLRADFKRHSQTPNWDLVRTTVHEPMIQLQRQLAEEIARREKPDSLVPVDRDPVPTRYRDLVRSYYERLGSGKEK